MADIDVEQKKGGNIWGWIIGILLIVLVIWGAMELLSDDEPEITTDPEPISLIEMPQALQAPGVPAASTALRTGVLIPPGKA